MCRLLLVKSDKQFYINDHLNIFSKICRDSKEYQGHGWGCSYIENGEWKHYKNINPIWEDNFAQFNQTNRLLAHARSAFQDKDIGIENNMPFYDSKYIFIFNGELRGVKIKSEGRIGAEKIFNFIKRFNAGDMLFALRKGIPIIQRQSKYIRAMNIIIADKEQEFITSIYNDDPDYFTMWYRKTENSLIVSSEPYPDQPDWVKIENNFIGDLR